MPRINSGYNQAAALGYTPAVAPLLRKLGPAGRETLMAAIAKAVAVKTKEHLREYARENHNTAWRLGGQPTHVLERARVEPVWSADGAAVKISAVGIGRAVGDVDIRPKKAKALTIPVTGWAYGHTVRDLRGSGWTIWQAKTRSGGSSGLLLGKGPDGIVAPLYILASHARIPHEPAMLPSDDELAQAAAGGVLDMLDMIRG